MTSERKQELRFQMWALAQAVLTDTAHTRAAMPCLLDEEYEYAREFSLESQSGPAPVNIATRRRLDVLLQPRSVRI